MGFGKKTDFETGRTLDLDKSYQNLIKPAVEAADLTCIRADEIVHSGLIDVPMYEQLLNADVVVADLSTSNKNAFYELGVRHALKPYTTIVISEDGAKTFPFDVNHVAIRQYHHLGEDIGYSEVQRFQKLLKEAILEIYEKDPRVKDSPVYTFLENLIPPEVAAAVKAAVEASSTTNPAGGQVVTPSAAEATHSFLMQQVDEAQQRGDFIAAKSLLATVRALMKASDQSKQAKSSEQPEGTQPAEQPEDPYIIQRLALLTYKSQSPTPEQSLKDALDLLATLNPQTSNDTETLGLWGGVNKRLYDLTKDIEFLSQSIRAYERGFYLRNDYYNGINFAYLLNLRAYETENRADAIADFVQAQRVRKEVLAICDQWLTDNPAPTDQNPNSEALKAYRKSTYWVLATKAEASIGMGETEKGQQQLQEAYSVAPEGWMRDSTQEQINKLRPLLTKSPLVYIQSE